MNQDGPNLIIETFPPNSPGPQIAKDVNVFTYEKLIIYCFSLLYLCLRCDEIVVTLLYLCIQHMVPQDPQNITKKVNNLFIRLLPYFTCWSIALE